ncbi:uncharacterized protein B0I36DRAFT_314182 [Microdochium trichocladiopsis]|uniref:Uncharacterized protein n=1 Tax=Microdochium trichocladiopsis TaxID=1682393 RepID=A0A9P9BS36_9PEZI|nr:uncharacterized protein B0I36DRAFT_314182 [Microdochium trichocladiopsis]KAH7037495.1 hypothetical protein B0I36DRAFT_314182 [Microdochium trichocladiopsis]
MLPSRTQSQAGIGTGGHPSAASYVLHYSPLQQNADRAISPTATSDPFSVANSVDEYYTTSSRPSPLTLDFTLFTPKPALSSTSTTREAWPDDGKRKDDEDDAIADDKLNQFSVKGLTSLASYPNPNQKAAQERLQRARPLPSPNNLINHGLRTLPKDLSWQPATDGQQTTKVALSASTLSKLPLNEGTLARSGSFHSANPLSLQPLQADVAHPLTAGPPGQRQVRPIGSQIPLLKLMTDKDKKDTNQQKHQALALNASHDGTFLAGSGMSMSPSYNMADEETASPTGLWTTHQGTRKIRDSLKAEEARYWYNGQLPTNFDRDTQAVDASWTHELLAEQDFMQHSQWRLARSVTHFGASHSRICLANSGMQMNTRDNDTTFASPQMASLYNIEGSNRLPNRATMAPCHYQQGSSLDSNNDGSQWHRQSPTRLLQVA